MKLLILHFRIKTQSENEKNIRPIVNNSLFNIEFFLYYDKQKTKYPFHFS